jgi:hypothetical protein
MAEIGLGIGRCVLPSDRLRREVLSWFDRRVESYLSAEEQERLAKEQAQQRAEQEGRQRERLEAFLRRYASILESQGFDHNQLLE